MYLGLTLSHQARSFLKLLECTAHVFAVSNIPKVISFTGLIFSLFSLGLAYFNRDAATTIVPYLGLIYAAYIIAYLREIYRVHLPHIMRTVPVTSLSATTTPFCRQKFEIASTTSWILARMKRLNAVPSRDSRWSSYG